MASNSLPPIETLDRVLEEAKSHEHAPRLSALCFDVLSSQAEGKALYAGRRPMRLRAATHRVTRAEAETCCGNLLGILERGPERSTEWALIAVFAVRGLDDRLRDASVAERREIVERFGRHADWLELSTPYAPYRFVAELLSEANQDALIEALETVVLAPSDGPSDAAHRARATLRIHVLSMLNRPSSRVVLARVAESTPDPWIKAIALNALGGGAVPVTDGFELKGAWGKVPRLSALRVLSYFTGIALLSGVARFIAFGLGLERMAKVRLESSAVHVHRETKLFGRTLRVSDASYALHDIECATREVSLPAFQVLFGALALAGGVVLGTIWLSDAFARNEPALFTSAAIALGIGAGLDLLFAGWGRLRKERAGFEMFVDNERVVALRKVDPERAQRLVEQIARRRGA